MKVINPTADWQIYEDVIKGDKVTSYKKTFAQIKQVYKNNEGVNDDTLMYEVYSIINDDKDVVGELEWGLTVLEAVYVNDECNITRGHFHLDKNCAEYYFGCGGEGLLMFMDETGYTWSEKVYKGSVHHINGKWAHRLVNTGESQLKVGCVWPSSAGHDYKAIEEKEFGYRVFKRNGKVEFEAR